LASGNADVDGNGVAATLRADGVSALDVADVDDAADEPSPGPHAASMIVASATTDAVDSDVDTRV
jgi:hypothetical protein